MTLTLLSSKAQAQNWSVGAYANTYYSQVIPVTNTCGPCTWQGFRYCQSAVWRTYTGATNNGWLFGNAFGWRQINYSAYRTWNYFVWVPYTVSCRVQRPVYYNDDLIIIKRSSINQSNNGDHHNSGSRRSYDSDKRGRNIGRNRD